MDIPQMAARLQKLQTEVAIIKSKREEEARKAHSALSTLAKSDIEMLSLVVPLLPIVANYSVEDILANRNSEVASIQQVLTELSGYLDRRLSHYEELL